MNNEINVDVKTLRPLTRFIYTIGVLPTSYLMSMTYEEQLVWLCNYLSQTVIPAINNNGEAVKELQELCKELKDYVDNYFDNLNIQEEINNKLEEMAESGELTDIIAQYLGLAGILAYNTKADLKEAQNIVNGSICKTLGDNEYNDGKGNFYKIRTITSTDVIDDDNILALEVSNTLIAEKIPDYNIEQINDEIENINNNKITKGNIPNLKYKNLEFDKTLTIPEGHTCQGFTMDNDYYYIAHHLSDNDNSYISQYSRETGELITSCDIGTNAHCNNLTIYNNLIFITRSHVSGGLLGSMLISRVNKLSMTYLGDFKINMPCHGFGIIDSTSTTRVVLANSSTGCISIGKLNGNYFKFINNYQFDNNDNGYKQGMHLTTKFIMTLYSNINSKSQNNNIIQVMNYNGRIVTKIILPKNFETELEDLYYDENDNIIYLNDVEGNIYKFNVETNLLNYNEYYNAEYYNDIPFIKNSSDLSIFYTLPQIINKSNTLSSNKPQMTNGTYGGLTITTEFDCDIPLNEMSTNQSITFILCGKMVPAIINPDTGTLHVQGYRHFWTNYKSFFDLEYSFNSSTKKYSLDNYNFRVYTILADGTTQNVDHYQNLSDTQGSIIAGTTGNKTIAPYWINFKNQGYIDQAYLISSDILDNN